jgi:hypothetical protein
MIRGRRYSHVEPVLPEYVERGGEVVYAHPHAVQGMRMYCFSMLADPSRLDALVERTLNAPSGDAERFGAAGGAVLLSFADIDVVTPAEPPDAWLGYVREKEMAVWVPLYDHRRTAFSWTFPYVFIDSPITLAGGREVYGYPKQLARFDLPNTALAPRKITVDSLSLEQHDPSEVAEWHRLVTVERPDNAPDVPLEPTWDDPVDLVRGFGAHFAGDLADMVYGGNASSLARQFARNPALEGRQLSRHFNEAETSLAFGLQLADMKLPIVLLKQFRDAEHPWKSCYTAINRVPHVVTRFIRGGFLPGDYLINPSHLAGEAIHRDLGLPNGLLTPHVAFWLEFDFVVERADILWDTLGRRG